MRALNHVREREKADIALFISLEPPTKNMIKDTTNAGFYTSVNGRQKMPQMAPPRNGAFLTADHLQPRQRDK